MMRLISGNMVTGEAATSAAFLRELARLIAASGKPPAEIAAAAGLPLSMIAGSMVGILRVPASRIAALATALEVDVLPLARLWAADQAPWLLDLLDAAEARGRASAGAQS